MTTANMANYRKEVIEAAQQIVQTGIMTKSLHGNVSMKVPDQDAFLLTAGGSLARMQPENIALFRLDGTLIEGTVMPVGAEIIQMHGIVYRERPEFQSVIHTHSPFATGFAVAGKPIPGAYEALVRNGMVDGVPLAEYGPRGSDESVNNIVEGAQGAYRASKDCCWRTTAYLSSPTRWVAPCAPTSRLRRRPRLPLRLRPGRPEGDAGAHGQGNERPRRVVRGGRHLHQRDALAAS